MSHLMHIRTHTFKLPDYSGMPHKISNTFFTIYYSVQQIIPTKQWSINSSKNTAILLHSTVSSNIIVAIYLFTILFAKKAYFQQVMKHCSELKDELTSVQRGVSIFMIKRHW